MMTLLYITYWVIKVNYYTTSSLTYNINSPQNTLIISIKKEAKDKLIVNYALNKK
jgi:hypothetical protein